PGVPLILVDSSHFNSNQNYLTTEMIFLRGNRFALIDSLFTLNERYCAFERYQTPSFTTLADRAPYRAVHVTVRDTVKLSGEEGCGDGKPPRAGTTMYQATYRWDPSKREFATISKALKRLDAANSKRL
ncbi:MAG: hypothetical protein JO047_14390, partial [Alphaproteobacteria bacterium]|nr:hypothetical protein [Alphaproteobacteria bacterium]